MILKASRRSGAKQLADHLLNATDNEHVDVHEVRGFMTNDLGQALNEIHAHARANQNIKKYLFSMSINPPKGKTASQADMVEAADFAEKRLGLDNQPRVIVFHEKRGHRHAHAVWSRVDENLKAIKLDYFKNKLTDISRELYHKHGWELPRGLQNKQARDLTNYSLSEHQAAKRHGVNPREIKAAIQHCWAVSNDAASFQVALLKSGFVLAKGDNNRSFVVLDRCGEIRGLSRMLPDNAKTIKAKLGKAEHLQTIKDAKASLLQSEKTVNQQTALALEQRHKKQLAPLKRQIDLLVKSQKVKRQQLDAFHEKRQLNERNARQEQYTTGLKGLWHYITGRYHKQKQRHEEEYKAGLKRDVMEKEKLIESQLAARGALQTQLESTRLRHQNELFELKYEQVQSLVTDLTDQHELTQLISLNERTQELTL